MRAASRGELRAHRPQCRERYVFTLSRERLTAFFNKPFLEGHNG